MAIGTIEASSDGERLASVGVLAIYVCQMAFDELSYAPIENSLVFFLAGMTTGSPHSGMFETAPAYPTLRDATFKPAIAT